MLQRLNPNVFTWQLWRCGSLLDLGVLTNRTAWIVERKRILRKHAVGYCDARQLACRPKEKHYAVMYFKDGIEFWSHLRVNEFEKVFADE
uniref:Uncharacterized protein n=1 Tax=viral metagenome TaxID=1070528 RepID=A0A6M3J1T7_9ZZZZ